MKRGKRYNRYCRTAAAISGILASFSVVLYPSAFHVSAAESEEVLIPVSQAFSATGDGADTAAGSFSYELAAETAGSPLPESTDASSNESSFVFSLQKETSRDISVSYTQAGEYRYTLSCATKDGNGYSVDPRVYTVEVYILPAGDGGVRLGAMYIKDADGNKKAKAEFSNSYDGGEVTAPDSVVAVDPPVKKQIKGTPAKDSVFCFSLQARDVAYPTPEGSEGGRKLLYITGAGEGEFGEWTYTEPGTYIYDITEVNTGEEGYAFDTTVYTITDTVTRSGNALEYTRSITAGGEAYTQGKAVFVNEYTGGSATDETQTASAGSSDGSDRDTGSSSSRISRLGGKDTGDTANTALFIVAPAAAAGIVTAGILGFRKYRKTK